MSNPAFPPTPTREDRLRVALLLHFTRLQLPTIAIPEPKFHVHLDRTFAIFLPKSPDVTWSTYLEGLYSLDWAV